MSDEPVVPIDSNDSPSQGQDHGRLRGNMRLLQLGILTLVVSTLIFALVGGSLWGITGALIAVVGWVMLFCGLAILVWRKSVSVPRNVALIVIKQGDLRIHQGPTQVFPLLGNPVAMIPLYELISIVSIEAINTKARHNIDSISLQICYRVIDLHEMFLSFPNRDQMVEDLALSLNTKRNVAILSPAFWNRLLDNQIGEAAKYAIYTVIYNAGYSAVDAYDHREDLANSVRANLSDITIRWGTEIKSLTFGRIAVDGERFKALNIERIHVRESHQKEIEAQREANRILVTSAAQAQAEAMRVRELIRALQDSGVNLSAEDLHKIAIDSIYASAWDTDVNPVHPPNAMPQKDNERSTEQASSLKIMVALLARGQATEDDLEGIPARERAYLLQLYQQKYSELDLIYVSTQHRLQYRAIDQLRLFNKGWGDARELLIQGEDPTSAINKMTLQFGAVMKLPIGGLPSTKTRNLQLFIIDTSPVFQNTHLVGKLLVIVLKSIELHSTDLELIRDIMMCYKGFPQRVALLVLFLPADQIDQARRSIDEQLRQPYACDVIAVSREDMVQMALQRDRYRALRRAIMRNVKLAHASPFTINGPVSSTAFFGREGELRQIEEHISSSSYVIIGGRRIGKSSLMYRLHHLQLPGAGFRTLYHDCSTTPTYKAFCEAVLRDWQPEPPHDAPTTFGELLQISPGDRPFVLLLDEADKLLPADRRSGWPLLNALRAQSNAGNFQIVLSGERTLNEGLQDSMGPLFNFATPVLLGPLSRQSINELVTRPMRQLEVELVDEGAILETIWRVTGGHPNVVQRLCQRLLMTLDENASRYITVEDVNTVVHDPLFQEMDFLQTYWEGSSPLEKLITLILTHRAEPVSLMEMREGLNLKHIQASMTEIRDAADRLVDLRSILKRKGQVYEFAIDAFPLVLQSAVTLDDLFEVLTEEYSRIGDAA